MKLYEYIFKHDNSHHWRIAYCNENNYDLTEYITEGFCPQYFKCFNNTEFSKPYAPYKKDITNCKHENVTNTKKCKECWNREIETEYEQYLRLKEKFEKE